jgi:hypothetical protein
MSELNSSVMPLRALVARLLLPLQRLRRPRQPLLTRALHHQALRVRNPHQAQEVLLLARSWLGAPDRRAISRALQLRMLELASSPQQSRKSTSSRKRTER